MQLIDVMNYKNFVILGDTLNPEKYAYKIKKAMLEHGYKVACVGKELPSINAVDFKIDIIDLCINPIKGLQLLQENKKSYRGVIIQPGAQSDDIINFLKTNKIPYLESCLLIGLDKYKNRT